jgi:hypothetical protein
MRNPRATLVAVPVVGLPALALLLIAACGKAPPPPWPDELHRAKALEVGGGAAGQLSSTLIGHLTAAVDSSGPAGAIDFCSTQALALTAEAVASMEGVEIRRTTTRLRNPANAPDPLDAEALAWFESQLASTGTLPKEWVQNEGQEAMRYYRPLVTNEMCVRCHGPVESLMPEVAAVLAERYPQDQAIGYAPGDFRGLIRVRIARAALEPAAP